jgi:hypothetical protein
VKIARLFLVLAVTALASQAWIAVAVGQFDPSVIVWCDSDCLDNSTCTVCIPLGEKI